MRHLSLFRLGKSFYSQTFGDVPKSARVVEAMVTPSELIKLLLDTNEKIFVVRRVALPTETDEITGLMMAVYQQGLVVGVQSEISGVALVDTVLTKNNIDQSKILLGSFAKLRQKIGKIDIFTDQPVPIGKITLPEEFTAFLKTPGEGVEVVASAAANGGLLYLDWGAQKSEIGSVELNIIFSIASRLVMDGLEEVIFSTAPGGTAIAAKVKGVVISDIYTPISRLVNNIGDPDNNDDVEGLLQKLKKSEVELAATLQAKNDWQAQHAAAEIEKLRLEDEVEKIKKIAFTAAGILGREYDTKDAAISALIENVNLLAAKLNRNAAGQLVQPSVGEDEASPDVSDLAGNAQELKKLIPNSIAEIKDDISHVLKEVNYIKWELESSRQYSNEKIDTLYFKEAEYFDVLCDKLEKMIVGNLEGKNVSKNDLIVQMHEIKEAVLMANSVQRDRENKIVEMANSAQIEFENNSANWREFGQLIEQQNKWLADIAKKQEVGLLVMMRALKKNNNDEERGCKVKPNEQETKAEKDIDLKEGIDNPSLPAGEMEAQGGRYKIWLLFAILCGTTIGFWIWHFQNRWMASTENNQTAATSVSEPSLRTEEQTSSHVKTPPTPTVVPNPGKEISEKTRDTSTSTFNISNKTDGGQQPIVSPVPVDLILLEERATDGDPDYAYELGLYYGRSKLYSPRDALKWYKLAAEKGHKDGLYKMGRYTEKGLGGLRKDKGKALEYYTQAKNAGSKEAADAIERLSQK